MTTSMTPMTTACDRRAPAVVRRQNVAPAHHWSWCDDGRMGSTPRGAAPDPARRRPPGRLRAAVAGVLSAGAGLAVAELLAAFVSPTSSPVLATGSAVVDAVPGWLKDAAISLFGTADKAVLLIVMGAVLTAGAAFAGVVEVRRPPWGAVRLAAVGVAGAVVAASRPGASATWVVPGVVGVAVAVPLLRALAATVRGGDAVRDGDTVRGDAPRAPTVVPAGAADAETPALDRRRFLQLGAFAAASAVAALIAARVVGAGARTVEALRASLHLPAPAVAAPAVPAGADLPIAGLAPYVTPNESFYRIDTALRVPAVHPDSWSLHVTGLVDTPFELTWAELLTLPLEEHHVTLACVSNAVGGNLIGNARWLGYPVRGLLARAGPHADADMVLSRSVDGFTASTPLDVLRDPGRDCLLAIGMNGEPLPAEHGFPARLVVPGLYGYVSATKWVTELRVTRFADDVAYWTQRAWSERGPIKLESRIDVPRPGATVTPLSDGTVVVAGVAWAQHSGIDAVEVQVADGPWAVATLAETVGADTWRQWRYAWDAEAAGPGEHTLRVRATDADGTVQTRDEAPPVPDGASGWHTISVRVR
jgi:DMSO/TMAO reductase YedYZ molybdopterin-dependent catalytic subunit